MIEFLRGKVADLGLNRICIDVNGVGYVVSISETTASLMPSVGEEVKIYTYMSVREDGVSLYGFPAYDDLEIFKLLISVSGVGPKGALAVLSCLPPDDLRFAILSGDSKAIAKAPGIGKKTAERVIIDLKDKISAEDTVRGVLESSKSVYQKFQFGRIETPEDLNQLPEIKKLLEPLKFFGERFRDSIYNEVSADFEKEKQLKAFQEIFAIRNLIAHQTFVEFNSTKIRGKSFNDIKQLHVDAIQFVNYLVDKFS